MDATTIVTLAVMQEQITEAGCGLLSSYPAVADVVTTVVDYLVAITAVAVMTTIMAAAVLLSGFYSYPASAVVMAIAVAFSK